MEVYAIRTFNKTDAIAMLIPKSLKFNIRSISGHKGGHFINSKWSIPKEVITILTCLHQVKWFKRRNKTIVIADGMIIYIENPKPPMYKLLE